MDTPTLADTTCNAVYARFAYLELRFGPHAGDAVRQAFAASAPSQAVKPTR